MKLNVIVIAAGILIASAASNLGARGGQIPAEFKNLQVLPKDITRPQLVQTMRQIAGDLGVRCSHCHVGPDNLEGMDFATDDKREKQVARTMLKMVHAINADYLSATPPRDGPRQPVTCVTCHRRAPAPPRPLPALLLEIIARDGTQAAIDQHRRMRDELLESGLYDFREATLNIVATRLREERKFAEALQILKRNAELFPQSPNALVNLGDTAMQMQNAALAEESYRKALAIDPSHPGAKRGLAAIKR